MFTLNDIFHIVLRVKGVLWCENWRKIDGFLNPNFIDVFRYSLPTRWVDFFMIKEPTLHAVCYKHWRVFIKYLYSYFQNLFVLSNKQTSKIDIS